MSKKFTVIGLGQFGTSIARHLASRGAEVLAIDLNIDKVETIKDEVAYAVALDATDARLLKAQNVQEMDAVVVAIGENYEGLLLTAVILLELGVARVIARATNPQQRLILEKVGVQEILSPEDTVGKSVAEQLLHPNRRSYLSLPDNYEIVEINTPPRVAGMTLREIDLRNRYQLNLITIRRVFKEKIEGRVVDTEHIIGVPKGSTVLMESDIIILIGKGSDINMFIDINK
ncbi:potassium channel family protein [Xanthovirga aplysinae]|uniref:potassium channel family protein n=1 Tax=Xanthovirga aplysinae TaxID=2529853 RepID=UPI0012BC71B8|nr:TrkA family potassium uptake protein [Xanthovirga aplysinae]MTI32410.1 TrkA family potassium uptake protein [Xanthovirga aplysinae]